MKSFKNHVHPILLLLIVQTVIVAQTFTTQRVQAQTTLPTVYILPKENSYPPGQSFNITVNVKDAELIHGWIFYLYWNPKILNCTKIIEGPWTSQGGTYKTGFLYYINNTIGRATVMDAIRGQYTTSGSGTMTIITFQVLQNGLTRLDLNNTVLTKRYFPSTQKEDIIPNQEDGYFQNPKTQIRIEPPETFAPPGSQVTLNLTATNLVNMKTWILNLTWNPQILNLTEVVEQPWNTTSPTTFNYTIDNQNGKLTLNSTLQAEGQGETGNRTLATLTFQAIQKGETTITIQEAQLLDTNGTPHITTLEGATFISIPKLSTKPKTIIDKNLKPGSQVTLNLTIENVENLNQWSATLTWNPQTLTLKNVEEGPFLKAIGQTTFIYQVNQEQGTLYIGGNLTQGNGANGSGVLAALNFTVKLGGSFKFAISNSLLLNVEGEEIIHAVEGTLFDNRYRDMVVQTIQLLKETAGQKETLLIRVTFLNNGTTIESFNYTIKFGRAIIDRGTIENLQPLESIVVETLFDIGALPTDIYEIKALIQYLPEEDNTLNNVGTAQIRVETQAFTLPWETIAAIIGLIIVALAAILAYNFLRKKPGKP